MLRSTHLKPQFVEMTSVFERQYAAGGDRVFVEAGRTGTCWLCLKQAPAVSFKKDAHVVPQSLGNRGWLTWDECDACNHLVGGHESALVASLAVYRVTSTAKRGRPKFKDPKSGSYILSTDKTQHLELKEPARTDGLAEVISEQEFHLRVPVDGYRPLSICKVLTRLALLLIPESRTKYDHLREWILGTLVLPEQALVSAQTNNGNVFTPTLRILRRTDCDDLELAVALTYGGAIYAYALPRERGPVSSFAVDRTMIEELINLPWTAEILNEDTVVSPHYETLTLVREPDATIG